MLPRFLSQQTHQVNWANPLNQGLVSWWLALPGRTGGGTWFDLCGRNHGTLTNSPSWVSNSRAGGLGSLQFLRASSQYVDCGSSVSTLIGPSGTASVWVYPLDTSSGILWGSNLTDSNEFSFQVFSGTLYVGLYLSSTDYRASVAVSSSTYAANTWQKFDLVWTDGAQSKLYRNGILIATAGSNQNSGRFSAAWRICRSTWSGSSYGNAIIGSHSIYSTAKSQPELWASYLDDLAGNPQTLNRIRRPLAFYDSGGGGGTVKFRRTLYNRLGSRGVLV